MTALNEGLLIGLGFTKKVPGFGTTVQFLVTANASWTVPPDFGAPYSIEAIGAGAGARQSAPSNGGGGGAYARVTHDDIAISAGNVVYFNIGTGGGNTPASGGDTWARLGSNSAPADITEGVLAKGGNSGTTDNTPPLGGQASASIGSVKFSGGSGGSGNSANSGGAGGGGAAGPGGAGSAGGAGGSVTGAGGAAGGTTGTGGAAGAPDGGKGRTGLVWGASGPGGGGGGCTQGVGANGGIGGLYGGGGGIPGASGGTGGAGLIVVTYTSY